MGSESKAEFELAVTNAWNKGRNDQERLDAFIEAVRDAEQAHREWATDLLDSALRAGMWKRLKERHRAQEPLIVKFAHGSHNVPSVGGVRRTTTDGARFEQLAFFDMSREELQAKQREYINTAFAARRNKHVVTQLLALLDKAQNASTPRQAAAELGTDIASYLAIEQAS